MLVVCCRYCPNEDAGGRKGPLRLDPDSGRHFSRMVPCTTPLSGRIYLAGGRGKTNERTLKLVWPAKSHRPVEKESPPVKNWLSWTAGVTEAKQPGTKAIQVAYAGGPRQAYVVHGM